MKANTKPRYLTKSRFKLANDCPTKLFYTAKKEYANRDMEDQFLKSLAEGGFQVGELAKCYFPGGYEVESLDYDTAVEETSQLLKREDVIIYEAAIRFESLFIRADILVKRGNILDLVEVKAKSYDSSKTFTTKKDGITSKWKPYLFDVAFQKHVISRAYPQCKVRASLMLADKAAKCPTDGLNQKFRIVMGSGGRKSAKLTSPLNEKELSEHILCQINVDRECGLIYSQPLDCKEGPSDFSQRIDWLAGHYIRDEKIVCQPSSVCKECEFRATPEEALKGLKSGFKECWTGTLRWKKEDFEAPSVLDIWNYRKKDILMSERRIKIAEVTKDDINPQSDGNPGLSTSERQWLQVEKAQRSEDKPWVEHAALKAEMKRWKFPLHFIDFETTMSPIPFNRGLNPYEMVAFQFSHHVKHEDGRIEHKGQYLNAQPGVFPNYEFVRALKAELESDSGSIFRYANHENTTLLAIYHQLSQDQSPPPDGNSLRDFIRSITKSTKDSSEQWHSERSMIDLCELVKRYYYAPSTNGSNSIKSVLPALLNQSACLKTKYSKPIYGAKGGITSLNFIDQTWIQMVEGQVEDPYKLLPKMFSDVSDHDFEILSQDDEVRDGGAAMAAYGRMQFEEMSIYERKQLENALLHYCELDTLAMVMIYEAWVDLVGA